MPRPKLCRRVGLQPNVTYFKPEGNASDISEEITLAVDEFEAVRLKDLLGLEQDEAAEQMNLSQPTFNRLLLSARRKVADAIVNGKALRIGGGEFELVETPQREFECHDCGYQWAISYGTGRSDNCPNCESDNFHRILKDGETRIPGRGRRGKPWRT